MLIRIAGASHADPFQRLNTLEYCIMIWTVATGPSMQFCNKTNERMASSVVHLLHFPRGSLEFNKRKYCLYIFNCDSPSNISSFGSILQLS